MPALPSIVNNLPQHPCHSLASKLSDPLLDGQWAQIIVLPCPNLVERCM